ncbi:hypothetical protein MASR1M48_16730 [Lactococcus petauri]
MSIETRLVMKVGDGINAIKAKLTLAFVYANIVGGETLTFTDPLGVETVLTEGLDFTGVDEPSFLTDLIQAINDIPGLTVTNLANPLIIEVDVAGVEGNEWTMASSDTDVFPAALFVDGRDADNPIDFDMVADSDGNVILKVDGSTIFRVPLDKLFDTNASTFRVYLQNFLRKLQV